ncbi:MAG: hypothetical protein HOK52_11345 [Candidatus Marinimicrobia bacterium]|jgi:hypothetical protein|nr:hypothetical protein [Candidatus Neomarinimicrobiota bacterium]MBT3936674.1 hypothetical protein [Candidatus Neomarinimicrobiota bacterium]MBT3960522.1 hypothetical protein [Candidatus Neomarinimicrobiota bacterium]MBT4382151.1 hypothetical protein [Candidatus Neomarinimicrobiota bacterium]MBT4635990.1 hypothetical protein [Candidatus Neomarinimicrobiota bacterium]
MIIVLAIGILTAIFGLLLIISPNTILKMEKHANHLIMTDPFFMKYRYHVGFLTILAGAYMIYTFLTT